MRIRAYKGRQQPATSKRICTSRDACSWLHRRLEAQTRMSLEHHWCLVCRFLMTSGSRSGMVTAALCSTRASVWSVCLSVCLCLCLCLCLHFFWFFDHFLNFLFFLWFFLPILLVIIIIFSFFFIFSFFCFLRFFFFFFFDFFDFFVFDHFFAFFTFFDFFDNFFFLHFFSCLWFFPDKSAKTTPTSFGEKITDMNKFF